MTTSMNLQLWTLALRNLTRRPRRTVLSVTAIALAALTMTLLYGLVVGLLEAGNVGELGNRGLEARHGVLHQVEQLGT